MAIFSLGFALLLGFAGGWIGSFSSPAGGAIGRWIGVGAGVILYLSMLIGFIPFERRLRRRATQDAADFIVEEISVTDPRVIEIGLINDNEPILAFEIGRQKLLFLQGQWLRDPETYGVDDFEDELFEDERWEKFLNGLPAPHSFPSKKFTLTRWPHSGRVLGIRVAGDYLSPERLVEALLPEYEFGDSEILEGELNGIADVLAREHERRLDT